MAARMTDQLGRVLRGRFRLVAPIGAGASAQVYLAEDTTLRRRVAVKILHPGLAEDEGFLRRFRDEARAAAAVSHPNLMAVYDWGEDDGPYLVLEYLGGGSLRSILDAGHLLSVSQAVKVGLEASRALEVAHRKGWVHRDIKPANLLFGEDGRLRIADFGLARALSEAGWTEHGDLVGTVRYAAPEQARGSRVDGRADLYSLGLVLVEAVTGTVPLTADNALATLTLRAERPVPLPDAMGPLIPVLARVGQPDPSDRVDAVGLERLLLDAATLLPAPAPLPLAGTGAEDDATRHFTPPAGDDTTVLRGRDATGVLPAVGPSVHGPPTRRRKVWLVPLLALLVFAMIAAGGAFAWYQLRTPTAEVPEVDGLELVAAKDVIAEADAAVDDVAWEVVETPEASETVAAGAVIRQNPAGGADLEDGGRIELFVSTGPPLVKVPDLKNKTQAEAAEALAAVGLGVGTNTTVDDELVPENSVVSWKFDGQSEPSQVPKGRGVELVLSAGPAQREIPTLKGRTEQDARAELTKLGISVSTVEEAFSNDVEAGLVVATNPAAGTKVERGSAVKLVVSKGPDLVTVPDTIGKTYQQAVSALDAAGLKVGEVSGRGNGRVLFTDPEPGKKVKRGSEVDIYLSLR